MDIYTKKKRSEIMSKISNKETKLEILVRSFLFKQGFRFRKNVKSLSGSPDVVLPKYKSIIFIHGCFWHSHTNCRAAKLPETRRDFWEKKIQANRIRDEKNINELKNLGWNVIIVWQCEIKNKEKALQRLNKLTKEIKKENY